MLCGECNKARLQISEKFPAYADLVSPKPPLVEQIKATLVDDEAQLSFHLCQNGSFVWAVPKTGPVVFAAINATSGAIESGVRKLCEPLESADGEKAEIEGESDGSPSRRYQIPPRRRGGRATGRTRQNRPPNPCKDFRFVRCLTELAANSSYCTPNPRGAGIRTDAVHGSYFVSWLAWTVTHSSG